MPLEEKDFIMRQTKQMAEGLGKFLGKKSVDEILQQDEKQADKDKKEKKKNTKK
ncbi:TPA: hypothetical protein RHK09_002909 [Enterococcus faecalis]|uniref:hypothetical protein n=1 Tax=Bacilli TaxID=91061 RepID=UPI00159F5C2B|nr:MULTISPECIES: hypothetical protein [Bacilli]EHU5031958.1 hypothetical protein [Enterococcus faecalis]HBC4457309.1 hypothetical protein [Enterococcus faecalis]HBC4462832.1 hypothetical protein [Enterococcus faecalis]HCU0731600.1 hypothetical protein [Enterococcus faecalis]HDT8059347.1 hypothetical protein [Enterococcus faecalis]